MIKNRSKIGIILLVVGVLLVGISVYSAINLVANLAYGLDSLSSASEQDELNENCCNDIQFDSESQLPESGKNVLNTSRTVDEAISWASSNVGRAIDFDGVYGAQCVDLVMAYYSHLGVSPARGNASDYTHNYLPDGWTRTCGGTPQKGDILVYLGGSYGHVAIYDSDYSVYQQNYCNHQWVEHTTFKYNDNARFRPCYYWGCIHPNFASSRPSVNIEEGLYNIYSCVGNKLIDVNGGIAQCGTNAQIWSPNFSTAQTFHIYYNDKAGDHAQGGYHIEMGHTDLFLDTAGNSASNGANIALWGDTGANGQYFIFEDAGNGCVYIRNLLGYYLDVSDGLNSNGTNVQTWQFADVPAQKYHLQKCSGGNRIEFKDAVYTVKSAVGNKELNVAGSNIGSNVNILSPNSSDNQLFHIYFNPKAGDNAQGGWHIESSNRNLFVDTAGDNGGPGTNTALWSDTGANGQYWILENAGWGYVYIRNLWGWYLDVDGNIEQDGRNVQVWSFNGGDGQKWLLNRLDYDTSNILSNEEASTNKNTGFLNADFSGSSSIVNDKNQENEDCFLAQTNDNNYLLITLSVVISILNTVLIIYFISRKSSIKSCI